MNFEQLLVTAGRKCRHLTLKERRYSDNINVDAQKSTQCINKACTMKD